MEMEMQAPEARVERVFGDAVLVYGAAEMAFTLPPLDVAVAAVHGERERLVEWLELDAVPLDCPALPPPPRGRPADA